jgi:hypothetical protein
MAASTLYKYKAINGVLGGAIKKGFTPKTWREDALESFLRYPSKRFARNEQQGGNPRQW